MRKSSVKALAVMILTLISISLPACSFDVDEQTLNSDLTVSFIDVGQGDSILIQSNNEAMLIDAGENDKGTVVVDYLQSHGVENLKYAVGTHPHSDHIGGMDDVLDNIKTENFICPETTYSTATWKSVISSAENSGTQIIYAEPYKSYGVGDATFTIYAPQTNSIYSSLNNYSVVLRLTYGDNSFLFTGDAEKISEKEMLSGGYNLSADVLKVGHHGSSGSTSQDFLKAVSPDYAVISCGKDNEYGHPHKETLSLLNKSKTEILRTDKLGTIVLTSDGKNVSVNNGSAKTEVKTRNENSSVKSDITYVGNRNTYKFHMPDCPSVEAILDSNKVYFNSREQAVNANYSPCKSCNP